MRIKVPFLVAAIAVALSGCAGHRYTSTREASMERFLKDREECRVTTHKRAVDEYVRAYGPPASSHIVPICVVLDACLAGRGYREDFGGELVVPRDAGIRCKPYHVAG